MENLYWYPTEREKQDLINMRYEVEMDIRQMRYLMECEDQKSDGEKFLMLYHQLKEMSCDFRRMAALLDQVMLEKKNLFFWEKEKEEIKYYN